MKKIGMIKKVVIFALLIICTNIIFSNISLASEFDYSNYTPGGTNNYERVTTIAGNVLGLVRNIGIIAGIIALMVIGFKYMTGSVQEKADYKKSMIPFVIGAALLIVGPTLVKVIYDFVKTTL